MRSRVLLGVLAALSAGAILGLGGFTLIYGKGYSYLLDDPKACINCHIMRDNFNTWTVSTHRNVTCNECHVPKAFPARYLSKASNGWFHSYAFTFEDVQVIRIKPHNERVLAANCASCHAPMVVNLKTHGMPALGKPCFECHKGVGHGF